VAGKRDRQRKLARERFERQQARRAQRVQRARLWTVVSGVCVAVIVLGVGGYFLFRPGGIATAASSATATPTATAAPTATPTPAATAAAAEPATHCTYTSNPPASRDVGAPPARPDSTASYQATITTNRGDVVIDLLNSKATCTVNSFVHLAAKKYFNNTKCHRLSTSGSLYMLQCGDPTATGSGGPGYEYANENLTGATYPQGTVAMAHTSQPDSNGSQFFLIYKNSSLPPSYTPFGRIIKGLGILQNVAKAGYGPPLSSAGGGTPKEKVVIESVTIKKT
jgi:peptidyl-prolyl cis-trans isomerase B (cyclophilin B)